MKDNHPLSSVRINLLIPLDISIQIEKESEKRGINRAQFVKEAIHSKLKTMEIQEGKEINLLREEVKEIKYLLLSALEKMQSYNKIL